MGFGIKELLIILVIVILLFGTKKLKGIGSDLGSAIKGFRKSMTDDQSEDEKAENGEKEKIANAEKPGDASAHKQTEADKHQV